MDLVSDDEYAVLRRTLFAARRRAGLTQQQLAARLLKPQSFVYKYELGARHVDVMEFIRVCYAIGADPHALVDAILEAAPHLRVRRRKRPANRGNA